MKKTFRRIIFFSPILLLAGILILLIATHEKPPVEEIKLARERITEAKNGKASHYSKNLFKSANMAYDSAMHHWKIENERFIIFRDYEKVLNFAKQAERLASASIAEANTNSKNLKKEIEKKIKTIEKRVLIFQSNFEKVPQIDDLRKQFNKGRMLFDQGKMAYEKADYNSAKAKIDEAQQMIDKSFEKASIVLSNYFDNYPNWQKWVKTTIEQSRLNKSACIIVDKFARECMLYQNGVLVKKYETDLGKNWMGTKNHQGDYKTPEGIYLIVDKKQHGRTKYHKALLINYPNDNDKVRYAQNKKNGIIPARKKIGDLIEIHGHGGQGADWTQGCAALSNKDMDELYSRVSVGTTVTIVGSLKPLNEILK
jgi:lipoprotein-anchoring transpeptidase ErfK/SrfK